MKRPGMLQGITVVDLSRLLPGPLASSILADNGARVIEVDAKIGGGEAVGRATLPSLRRNKESIRIDIRKPAGHGLFLELVKRADVMIEGFRPDAARGLGVDYATVGRANPRIICCSITGYGQTGPMSGMAGHDINYISVSGVADLLAPYGQQPFVPGVQLADVFGGSMQAVVGILMALRWRDVSGRGQHLDIGMTEGSKALATLAFDLQRIGMPFRSGESMVGGGLACYGFYKASDGRAVAIGALETKLFKKLCDALGVPELVPLQYDPGSQPVIREKLTAIFACRTAEEWEKDLGPKDVSFTRVRTFEEAVEYGRLRACEVPEDVSGSLGPELPRFGLPVTVCESADDSPQRIAPPGAQTERILREIGLSDAEITRLSEEGVAG